MGSRLRVIVRAFGSPLGLVARTILLLASTIALFSIVLGLRSNDVSQRCRAEAAAHFDSAVAVRDDALADSQETVLRLFSASFTRDQGIIAAEGAKLPDLFNRIHEATVAIKVANEERIASIDACTKG